ncbi:MAG: fasciclin domain-containing protein [Rhodobacteraceae bacterium]|nr:fasciclin domain-containing protein [Paracoccaceae bacterium]
MKRRSIIKGFVAAGALAALGACAQQEEAPTIVDIAAGNDDFSTLVAAVTAAGLVDTLSGDGPFTVFAPTNDAFAALPAGTVESLLEPENIDTLTDILTYHVISGNVTSDQVIGQNLSVEALNGGTLTINGAAGKFGTGVTVNDANVIATDIIGSNGVIHVIDSVLLP